MTTRHRPDLSTRIVCDFWLVATMATMATPRGRPLKKSVLGGVLLGVYHPSIPPFIYFSRFNLGWPLWPWWPCPEHQPRPAASARRRRAGAARGEGFVTRPAAWRHSNGRELLRLRAFWLVATMATMATPGGRPLKKYRPESWVLVRYHPPPSSPLYLFFQDSI